MTQEKTAHDRLLELVEEVVRERNSAQAAVTVMQGKLDRLVEERDDLQARQRKAEHDYDCLALDLIGKTPAPEIRVP